MASIKLKSFPFDSQKVLNEQSGQMEGDRRYDAKIFADYFKKFLSNGVYYGHYKNYGENSMKVSLSGGLNVKISKGAGIIEGVDYELENDTTITMERPSSGSRVDRIVVRKNSALSSRDTVIDVKKGNGTTAAALQRDDNIYEICIAEVTVKSTANLAEADIKDTRLSKTLCGVVTSLVSIDGEALYQKFQAYIDSMTDNLVKKNQNSVITGKLTVQGGIEGNVKGNVTGNCTGSSGSCTGNARKCNKITNCENNRN